MGFKRIRVLPKGPLPRNFAARLETDRSEPDPGTHGAGPKSISPAEIIRCLSREPGGATIWSGCAEQARSCTKTKETYRAKD